MTNNSRQLFVQDEQWREFFSGAFHQQLSLSLSEAFFQILNHCVKVKLIVDYEEEKEILSRFDAKDLSDSTNLISHRFKTVLTNKNGYQKMLPLAALLNQALRPRELVIDAGSINLTKEILQKSRDLEIISNVLKLGRNLDAHIQNPIIQLGFTLQICSAVIRLFEIFNLKKVQEKTISELRHKAEKIIAETIIKKETGQTNETLKENKETYYNLNIEPNSANSDITDEGHEIENDNQPDYEEPIDVEISSDEISRQKLERLRLELKTSLRKEGFEFTNREIILEGSILKDIIVSKPKTKEALYKVFSVQLLIDKKPDIVKFQIENYAEQIVSNFQ